MLRWQVDWSRRCRLWMQGLSVAVAFCWACVLNTALAAPQPATAQTDAIRLLSWNIRLDTPADGTDGWPYRAHGVIDLLQQHQPDVIGLQEVLWHQLVRLESALPGYQRVGLGRNQGLADSRETGEFSPILFLRSRFTLLSSGTFWLNPTNLVGQAGWDAALPRICSWVLLQDKHNGQRWRVLNVHLDHQGSESRRASITLISNYIKKWQAEPMPAPAVLMGDFNPASDDGLLAKMTAELPQHQDVLQVKPNASSPAYSFYGWGETAASGVRLDFMLVPVSRVQVDHAQIIQAIRPKQVNQPPHSGRWSDHLPLQADLRQSGR